MEAKKTQKADLENKKGLFFQVGLVLVLAFILWAFNYKSYDQIEVKEVARDAVEVIEDVIIQTVEDQPISQPEPQQVETTEFKVHEDEEKLDNEYKVRDMSADNATNQNAVPVAPVSAPVEKEEEEKEIFTVVEDSPEFLGGEAALMTFMKVNIKYPDQAKQMNASGVVYVTFVVERDGSITDVKVLRDNVGGGCGAEAVRVVKAMPKWKPGKQRGKPVRVAFNLPVRFTLR